MPFGLVLAVDSGIPMDNLAQGKPLLSQEALINRWMGDRSSSVFSQSLRPSRRASAADPGGTPSTAQVLGGFPGKRSVRNTVSRRDKDVYQLTLSDLSTVKLTFKNRSKANLFGAILDSQGKVFSLRRNKLSISAKAGEEFNDSYEELPAGTYFLRVQTRSGGKNAYRLTLAVSNTFPSLPDCGCES